MRTIKNSISCIGKGQVTRIGIAGTLSGPRTSHAPIFREATGFFEQRGIAPLLGDDASNPAQALQLAHEFASRDVKLVIGHFNSACAAAAIQVYRERGVNVLLPASSAIEIKTGQGVIRLCSNDAEQARAIAEWITHRFGPQSTVEVRVDGSDYSGRLLACLQSELGASIQIVANTVAAECTTSPVCVVLAVAQHAIDFVKAPHFKAKRKATIFSDEAAVDEFRIAAAQRTSTCWVTTPNPSYSSLMRYGCELAASWCALNHPPGNFNEWAATGGWSLSTGESSKANWSIRHCVGNYMENNE